MTTQRWFTALNASYPARNRAPYQWTAIPVNSAVTAATSTRTLISPTHYQEDGAKKQRNGRYQAEIFDLVMGFNRWVYRVLVYVLLMRDEHPPFRLDMGGLEASAAPRLHRRRAPCRTPH